MFVGQAHSFAQQARLAITLAWVAGYSNIIAVLTCGTVISHVSGTTSSLGRDVAEGKWRLAAFALFLLVTFLLGAALSGFTTELGRRRGWRSIYVVPMMIQALLLTAFAIGVELHGDRLIDGGLTLYAMTGVGSMAMGLQNATITRISSGVVRTTHVTGVLTDLGLELVQFLWWLRDKSRDIPPGTARGLLRSLRVHPPVWRLLLLISIMGSFAIGAGLGSAAHVIAPRWAMFPPVLFLLWIVYQDVVLPIVEISPASADTAGGPIDLPRSIAVFHLRRDANRKGKVHRMPNLLNWADRLDTGVRVVILDLGEVTELDDNAALELRAVLLRLRSEHREMVIAGLNPPQFRKLAAAGAGDLLDPHSVCPDLELAIARGLNLLDSLAAETKAAVGR